MKTSIILILIFYVSFFQANTDRQTENLIHPDYQSAIESSAQQSKPILLLFTSDTCKNPLTTNEILHSTSIKAMLNSDFIFLNLNVSDPKKLLPDEVYFSAQLNQKITSVGLRNIDLELSKFDQNVQPYYIVINHKEETLLSSLFMESEEKVLNFLVQAKTVYLSE